jgi:hypothetical protein
VIACPHARVACSLACPFSGIVFASSGIFNFQSIAGNPTQTNIFQLQGYLTTDE